MATSTDLQATTGAQTSDASPTLSAPPAQGIRRIAVNLLFIDGGNLSGPGYYAVQLVEKMLRLPPDLRWGVDILCYVQPAARRHFSAEAQPYLKDFASYSGRIVRVVAEQSLLPMRVRRDKVDLLFSPGFVSPLWGAPHLAVTICDMYYRVIPHLIEGFQRRYWSVMIPLSVWASEVVLTISASSQRDIEQYLPRARGRTVSTPLASRFAVSDAGEPVSAAGPPFVLIVANLTANKNCEAVVAAVAHLRAEGREIDLVHVGRDHLGLLAAAVATHGAEGYVRTLGKVSDETLIGLYRSCLCAVVPSFYEGFGMPAIEAQSLGAPLISSNRSSLPEAAGDAALYFDPDDSSELARHIDRLLADPALRSQVREAGFRHAATFSWERTADATMRVFRRILRLPEAAR